MDARRIAQAFVVGSSLPAGAVSLTYLGRAHAKAVDKPLTYEAVPFAVLAALGTMNALSVATQMRFGTRPLPTQAAFGAATGMLFSLVGRMGYQLPRRIFGMTGDTRVVHVLAPLLYAGIFSTILLGLNKVVLSDQSS